MGGSSGREPTAMIGASGASPLHIFRGHFRIEADLHASLAGKVGVGTGQLIHLVLEGERLLTAQDAAKAVFFSHKIT